MDFVEGKLPCPKIYEDDKTFAFLDESPLTEGHTLVIPKEPIDQIDHCPPDVYQAIFATTQKVSEMLQKTLKPIRVALVVHGMEVPHAHVHVIPLYTGKEIHIAAKDREKCTQRELNQVATKIRSS